MKIAVLPGDGIGPEVTSEAVKVLEALDLPGLILFDGDVGGVAYKRHGQPLPAETLTIAKACDMPRISSRATVVATSISTSVKPSREAGLLRVRRSSLRWEVAFMEFLGSEKFGVMEMLLWTEVVKFSRCDPNGDLEENPDQDAQATPLLLWYFIHSTGRSVVCQEMGVRAGFDPSPRKEKRCSAPRASWPSQRG